MHVMLFQNNLAHAPKDANMRAVRLIGNNRESTVVIVLAAAVVPVGAAFPLQLYSINKVVTTLPAACLVYK